MMKKIYSQPTTMQVRLVSKVSILAGSPSWDDANNKGTGKLNDGTGDENDASEDGWSKEGSNVWDAWD